MTETTNQPTTLPLDFIGIKKAIPLLLLVFNAFYGYSQMYFDDGRMVYAGDSTVEGSYQSLGINPANLGRVSQRRKGGAILQVGGNFYSDGLDFQQVIGLTFREDSLGEALKNEIVSQTASGEFAYEGNLDVNWFSYSYASPTLGGIAVNVQDRLASTATIPNEALGIMLLGENSAAVQNAANISDLSGLGDGADVSYSHIRAVRIGYGRMIARVRGGNGGGDFRNELFRIYAGGTLQLLWGVGYFNGEIQNGNFSSKSTFADLYRVNYGQLTIGDPLLQRQLLNTVGQGVAFDLGLGVDIGEKISFGASIVDVGGLTWDEGIVTTSTDFVTLVDSSQQGLINSYQISQEAGNFLDLGTQGTAPSFETLLNAQTRLNFAYRLNDRMRLGGDMVIPLRSANPEAIDIEAATLTGSFSWAIVPQYIYLSSGFIYNGSFGARLPLGISANFGGATFNISTADLLTLAQRRRPLASLSVSISGL